MSDKVDETSSATKTEQPQSVEDKGKGKASAPIEEPEDDSDSDMEEDDSKVEEEDAGEESEDDMGEIDTSNIIESGRTRGKRIDYTKEVQNIPEVDDEEDDADFEEPASTTEN